MRTSIALVALGVAGVIATGSAEVLVAQSIPKISSGGTTLVSKAIELPADDQHFPDGAHADVVTANCTACHSASMTLNQPKLSPDQWKATVTKMREVYKAPIADENVPAILSYLNGIRR